MGKTKATEMHGLSDLGQNVPAFLAKLWKMVNDDATDDLISWTEGHLNVEKTYDGIPWIPWKNGTSFVISNQAQFSRDLLPFYYKHCNLASFIRQLNMYGFHKIVSIESGGLKSEKDEMEFAHPYFIKDYPQLLENIKRKMAPPKTLPSVPATMDEVKTGGKAGTQNEILARVLSEVNNLKGKQDSWDARLSAMKRENEALWRELAVFRQKHLKQEQIINKLIHFIVTMVQPSRNVPLRRRYPLMLSGSQPIRKMGKMDTGERSPSGPTILEIDPTDALNSVPSTSSTVTQDFVISENEFIPSSSPKPAASPSTAVASGVAVSSPSSTDDTDWQILGTVSSDGVLITNPLTPIDPAQVNPAAAAASLRELEMCYPMSGLDANSSRMDSIPVVISHSPIPRAKGRKTSVPSKRRNKITVQKMPESDSESNSTDLLSDIISTEEPGSDANLLDTYVVEAAPEDDEPIDSEKSKGKILLGSGSFSNAAKEHDDGSVGSLAVVRQGSMTDGITRYHSTPHDLQGHVDSVQGDLDYLKEMLKGDGYSLDANTLLGLFSDDPLVYEMPPGSSEDSRDKENGTGGELMTYGSPNLMDLVELYGPTGSNEWFNMGSPQRPLSPLSELATPQALSPSSSSPPIFPSPSKRRKK